MPDHSMTSCTASCQAGGDHPDAWSWSCGTRSCPSVPNASSLRWASVHSTLFSYGLLVALLVMVAVRTLQHVHARQHAVRSDAHMITVGSALQCGAVGISHHEDAASDLCRRSDHKDQMTRALESDALKGDEFIEIFAQNPTCFWLG